MTAVGGGMLAKSALIACLCAPILGAPRAFIRGDATGDGLVDAGDAAASGRYGVGGAGRPGRFAPPCPAAGDVGGDGAVTMRDVCALMDFLMRGGPAPAPPFPEPGLDAAPRAPNDKD